MWLPLGVRVRARAPGWGLNVLGRGSSNIGTATELETEQEGSKFRETQHGSGNDGRDIRRLDSGTGFSCDFDDSFASYCQ